MISVLTGDIINSRKSTPENWLDSLKSELDKIGKSPEYWEIYGGDTFQLRVDNPTEALLTALKIKAVIKKNKLLDVRISIGIGDMDYKSSRVTESNGSAFIHSGQQFQLMKKEKLKLAVKSNWNEFDEVINLCLKLGMFAMDKWTEIAAETILLAIANPDLSQSALGEMLDIKQNAVSNRLNRANFNSIMEIDQLYKKQLNELL